MTLLLVLSIMFGIIYCIILGYLLFTAYAMISGAPYVPTNFTKCTKMIQISGLKAGEKMTDFGSGDGRLVFCASKTGAVCMGVELNPFLYALSRMRLFFSHIKNITLLRKNMWNVSLQGVDVLTLYLIPHKMKKMKRKIFDEMQPGARIVSHGFTFPDWQYVQKDGNIYLYIV